MPTLPKKMGNLSHRTHARTHARTQGHEEQTYPPVCTNIGLGASALLALTRKFRG